MKRSDLAYCAGIIDGEGSITIQRFIKPPRQKSPRYLSVVVCSMTSRSLISWLQKKLGGTVFKLRMRANMTKAQWRWQVTSSQAKTVCKLLRPFLKLKRQQAAALIRFQTHKDSCINYGSRGVPKKWLAIRERFYQEVRALNA